MDKTIKKLKPALLELLRERYSEEEVASKWIRIETQYWTWLREEGDLGGSKNFMSSNMTLGYLIFACYDQMGRQLSHDEFLRTFHRAMGSTMKTLNRINMNWIEEQRWLMKLIYAFAYRYEKKSQKKRGNEWGNTWNVRVNPDRKTTGVAFVLHSCPLYEFAQEYGYMDVLPYMCACDHLVAEGFHAHLIRHKRLSDGDNTCEYWYVGDQSKEALADPGSK